MEPGRIPTFQTLEAVDEQLQTDAADNTSEVAMSAAGAAPSAIISTGSLDELMKLLLSSPLTSVSIDLENDLQGVLQRALSTILSVHRQLTPSVAPSATVTSSVPHMLGSGSNPSTGNSMTSSVVPHMFGPGSYPSRKRRKSIDASMTSSVVPHMSGPGSNPSRKRRMSIDASLALAIVKKLRAEEIAAILIKAYENHRDVRDAVNASLALAIVKKLRAEEIAAILIKAYENHGDVRDAVNASLASAIVKELRAEESAAILIKAYEKHCDVRDAVNAAFNERRVHVHNIPLTTKPDDLYNFFMPFGEIVDTKITTCFKGAVNVAVSVGYVFFEKPEYAEKAVNFGQLDFLGSKIELHAGSFDCSRCGIFI